MRHWWQSQIHPRRLKRSLWQHVSACGLVSALLLGVPVQAAPVAQEVQPFPGLAPAVTPSPAPLDLETLQAVNNSVPTPGLCPVPPELVTVSTICQNQLTIPSLWWAREQFGGRLLENWLAYSEVDGSPQRIDLVVNPQVWSLLNYTERYAFVHQFGASAREFRYNTRIFNRQGVFLAAHTCDFSQLPTAVAEVFVQERLIVGSATAAPCKVVLNSSRRDGLRRRPPGL